MYLDSLKNITTKLVIYYDGHCPLCLAEIHLLKHNNQKNLLDFVSLQEVDNQVSDINCALAFKTIHARLGDHKIIVGPEVFFEAYKRSDLILMNYLFSFRLFRFFFAKFYIVFAKYRHKISRVFGPFLLSMVKSKYPR